MPSDSNQNLNTASFNNPVDEKTKLTVLRTLIASKSSVRIQMDDKTFESTIFTTTDISKIAVNCANSSQQQDFKTGQEMTCYFSIKNEFYFFTSKTAYTDTALIFSTPQILYSVQRRDNFRVDIPSSMNQKVGLVGHKFKVNLKDLSLGGCRIEFQYSESSQLTSFKAGSEAVLSMTFFDFENEIVHCKVKFLREDVKTKTATMGLEFGKLKAEEIQEMRAVIFKIERLSRRALE